jgi:thiosulfate oxidation carrier complex protein SoxZ
MARRAAVKILDRNYSVGDTVKVQAIIIHPMDTGFNRDKHSGELKPRFYVSDIEVLYNGEKLCWLELGVSASENPKVIVPVKVTGPGELTFRFTNSEGEVTVKTAKVRPQ